MSYKNPFEKIDSPERLIYGCILILIIVYSSSIPSEYRRFADSILGRVFGIAIIYAVIQTLGIVYGLLTALAFLLILHGASRITEGFETTKVSGHKWYVEQVLREDPRKIKTHEVITNAPSS